MSEIQALISIIVPVYNVEKFLDDCIQSIINQSYPNIEILLINDGSTDKSLEICNKYASEDCRIKVFSKSNGGLSDARNHGIDRATGEYITFIDSDDIIHPNLVEYLYKSLISVGADISVCQRKEINEYERLSNIPKTDLSMADLTVYDDRTVKMRKYLIGEIDTVAWGKLYSAHLFESIRFPVGKLHEDVFTTYLLIDLANKIITGSAQLYYYRLRGQSIARMSFTTAHLDALYGKEEQLNFLEDNYPELINLGKANLAYTASYLAVRIYKNKPVEKKYISQLQKIVRDNISSLLHADYISIKTKIFALIFSINQSFISLILRHC